MKSSSNNSSATPQHWEKCPSGTLQSYADKKRSQDRRRVGASWLALLGVFSLGIALSVFLRSTPNSSDQPYGGIACHEVINMADAYLADTVTSSQRRQIEAHLRDCPTCAKKFRDRMHQNHGKLVRKFRFKSNSEVGLY